MGSMENVWYIEIRGITEVHTYYKNAHVRHIRHILLNDRLIQELNCYCSIDIRVITKVNTYHFLNKNLTEYDINSEQN